MMDWLPNKVTINSEYYVHLVTSFIFFQPWKKFPRDEYSRDESSAIHNKASVCWKLVSAPPPHHFVIIFNVILFLSDEIIRTYLLEVASPARLSEARSGSGL